MDQEVSSEIDWLRFFWRFMTAAQDEEWESEDLVSAPTFWDVVHLVTYTQVNDPWPPNHELWTNLQGTVMDMGSGLDVYEDRFNGLTTAHGVYNHGP